MLEVKDIVKSYTTGSFTQRALDHTSLAFRESEFVAILGPSGSGKTTFLNIVGGLDRYDDGDLIINGKTTKQFKDRDWDAYRNNSVGFIFQSYNLISHLSIMDNVEMGMTLSGVPRKIKHEKAVEVLTRVGLKDHMHKKPGQLSGGQMQRVAIARALANDPDIILADEPTGALDSETSVQIMDLIKEIAKDKLVIMVTHNPELAKTYADRIVEFKDGKVISDSNPFKEIKERNEYSLKKTSMSFFTALKVSGRNISTKLGRTLLTSFASSIGIIGIALILSLSNGFGMQIDKFETDTMSGFPISISQTAMNVDFESISQAQREDESGKFPTEKVVIPFDESEHRFRYTNNITQEYMDYLNGLDPNLTKGWNSTRIVNMSLLNEKEGTVDLVDTSNLAFQTYPEVPEGQPSYLSENYDLLEGSFPNNKNEAVLLIDESNRLSIEAFKELGYTGDTNINFNDLIGKEFRVAKNNDIYSEFRGMYVPDTSSEHLSEVYESGNTMSLKVVGVIRIKDSDNLTMLENGVIYSDAFAKEFIEDATTSEVVKAQLDSDINVLSGQTFENEEARKQTLEYLGGTSIPSGITIYPKDFDSKTEILNYLDAYNEGKPDGEKIVYTDYAATMTSLTSGIMGGITIVLIAFASISLVVSLIMVSIITYISVLERKKEIGVLRALGARKKDISRVFNAETFIIGLCSGILGIIIAYLLTLPINSVLLEMTELENVAQLNPLHAIILVVLSLGLTMLGGLIPARMAAKKDPVEALRSE